MLPVLHVERVVRETMRGDIRRHLPRASMEWMETQSG